MRKIVLLSLLILLFYSIKAQNNVGIGTLLPNTEAILELSAADKGFLMTRLNAADTSLFAGNTEGMMFYAIDIDRILYYGAGKWNPISIGGINVWELIGNDISNINTGNVGIGISSPQNLLHISGTDATVDGSSGVWAKLNNQVVGTGPVSTGFLLGTYNNPSSGTKGGIFFRRSGAFGVGDLIFSSNSNLDPGNVDASDAYVKMIIENGGNVGIGTVSPSTRLDVEQIPSASPSARFFNGNIPYDDTGFQNSGLAIHSASIVGVGAVSTIAALPQLSGNYPSILSFRTAINGFTPSQERMRILSSGRVGIGSFDAVNLLDVAGNMAVGSSYSGTNSAPANSLIVEGRLGIENPSPSYPLHIFSSGSFGDDFGTAVIYGNSNFNSNSMVIEGNSTGSLGAPFVYSNAFVAGYATNPTGINNYGVWGHQPGTGVGGYGVIASNGPNKTSPNRYVALAGTSYAGIFMGGNVGIGTAAPNSQLQFLQSDASIGGSSAIRYYWGVNYWRTFHSGAHYSFEENGVRRAYVEAGSGNYVQPSDANLKKNISGIPSVLSKVGQLNPVSYHYNDVSSDRTKTIGFLAQEVEQIFPEIVRTAEDGTKALSYTDFSILAIKAIQEQQKQIEALQKEIQMLKETR